MSTNNSPELGFGNKKEQLPPQAGLPIGLIKDISPLLSSQAYSLPRYRDVYFPLQGDSFVYVRTLGIKPKDEGHINHLRSLLENDTQKLKAFSSQFNKNHLATSSDRKHRQNLAIERQKHARSLLRAAGIDPFSIRRFEAREIPEEHRKYIEAQTGVELETPERSLDTAGDRLERTIAVGVVGSKRLPLQMAAVGLITGGLLLGSLARPTSTYAADTAVDTKISLNSSSAASESSQSKTDDIEAVVIPEIAGTIQESSDVSVDAAAASEQQSTSELALLTGSQLEAKILEYVSTDILPLVSDGASKDIWKDVVEISDDGTVTLKADVSRPVVIPEVGLTVEELVRYNSDAHTVEIGTQRSYSDKLYQIFVIDAQGTINRFYLPRLSYSGQPLTPAINDTGVLVYRDSNGSEIVAYGDANLVINGKASPLITSFPDTAVSFVSEQPSGVGGPGSLVYTQSKSEPVQVIDTGDSAKADRLNYVLTAVDKSFPISFSKALLPEGGTVVFNSEESKFELQIEGKRYALFDPQAGQFSFLVSTDRDSVNIRPDPSIENAPVGQYVHGEDIPVSYKNKPQGQEFEWMRTDKGWVRGDLLQGRTDFVISVIPTLDVAVGEAQRTGPVTQAAAGDFKSQYSFPEPSPALLERLGLDLQTAVYKSELLPGPGETYKIRIYDNSGNFVVIGETNDKTAEWEWKEAFLEGIPYPEAKQLSKSLKTYTRDLGFSESEVMNRLRYEPRADFRGESYPLLVDTQTGYPIMVWVQSYSGEWKWEAPTINTLSPKKGLEFGLAVGKGDKDWQTIPYYLALRNNAHVVVPVGHSQLTIDQWGSSLDDSFAADAFKDGQAVRFSLFWNHADVGRELQGIYDQYKNTPDLQIKVSEYMDKRIDQVLAIAERGAGTAFKDISEVDLELIIGNEAFWESDGAFGWEKSPYLDAYQTEDATYPVWLVESYIKTFNKVKEKGFNMDRVKLMYNDYDIENGGNKSKLVLSQLKLVKEEIARRLGIPVEQVKFYVGMQSHLNLSGMNEGDKINSSDIELPQFNQNMIDYAQTIGPVMHTEVNQTAGTLAEKSANIIALTKACEQVGPQVCQGITFFGMMRVENADWQILFDSEYNNTLAYWELLKELSSNPASEN